RVGAAFQDAGDDFPWVEGAGDVERHLDELADVLLRLPPEGRPFYRRGWLRGHNGTITPETLPQVAPVCVMTLSMSCDVAYPGRLPGREREERVRLACLRVLLEALDDQTPGVVDGAQVVLGHGRRPLGMAEEHGRFAVFGGGEVPGDGRPIPVGEVGEPW